MIYNTEYMDIDYSGYGLETPKNKATLTSYILERSPDVYLKPKRPTVIICPGGGYEMVAPAEGEPVALAFNARGIHAFVLNYSITPVRFPGALLELSRAVSYVRNNAEKYNIDEGKIAVCGFSAGGHLAASLGVYWHEGFVQRFLGIDNNENRPDGLVLCYPVISGKESLVNKPSLINLLGKYPDEQELKLFSLENNVSELTPPAFIWHTADDDTVPAQNSIEFAKALAEHDIPYELHIFPHAPHGISLATDVTARWLGNIVPDCQPWIDMAAKFILNL